MTIKLLHSQTLHIMFDAVVMGTGAIIGLMFLEPNLGLPSFGQCAAILLGALTGSWFFGHSGLRYRISSKADLLNTLLSAVTMGLLFALISSVYNAPASAVASGAVVAFGSALGSIVTKIALLVAARRPVASGEWPKLFSPRNNTMHVGIGRGLTYRVEPAETMHAGGQHALVLSLTPVTDEPRVRRQCEALWRAGWTVTVVGYASRSPKPSYWELIQLIRDGVNDSPRPLLDPRFVYARVLGIIARLNRLGLSVLHSRGTRYADMYYWLSTRYPNVYHCLVRASEAGVIKGCDLVVAHDWFTAPIASRLARDHDAAMTIDCHEYSTGQYMHRPEWVKHERPFIHAIEKRYFPRAAAITTVCEGIADLLASQYRLRVPPVVIRSVARYEEVPHHESEEPLEIAYSGLIDPIRGLEELIHGVARAERTFLVVLRGPVTAGFDQHLMGLASSLGIDGRVRIEPPVPFSEIVSACSRSDIGYFVHEDISPQKRFVLPNKFFEYIMAGLALCVSDLPEMARIVRHHDLGILVPGCEPRQIADALNGFDSNLVKRFRRNTRAAARVLNWERESIKMVELYGRIAARSAPQGNHGRPAQRATHDG